MSLDFKICFEKLPNKKGEKEDDGDFVIKGWKDEKEEGCMETNEYENNKQLKETRKTKKKLLGSKC